MLDQSNLHMRLSVSSQYSHIFLSVLTCKQPFGVIPVLQDEDLTLFGEFPLPMNEIEPMSLYSSHFCCIPAKQLVYILKSGAPNPMHLA